MDISNLLENYILNEARYGNGTESAFRDHESDDSENVRSYIEDCDYADFKTDIN
jgi:hypothetical protein